MILSIAVKLISLSVITDLIFFNNFFILHILFYPKDFKIDFIEFLPAKLYNLD